MPTIERLEAQDGELGGRPDTIERIIAALVSAGIAFLNGGDPGVRLTKRRKRPLSR